MSRLSFKHPNRKQLLAWLSGSSPDDSVITMHVDRCDRCADLLGELAGGLGDDGAVVDDDLANAIREVYEPPADLNSRVLKKIDARERADRELNLFLGLFAIGKDAAELMMPPDGDET
jgi:hypothetical protein